MLLYNFPVLILGQPFVCGNYHPTFILDKENLENIRAEQVKTVLENMRAGLRFQCFLKEKKVFLLYKSSSR